MPALPIPVEPLEPRRLGTRAWLPALQSLRGLAALWVVLYHVDIDLWRHYGQRVEVPGVRLGWLGVDLFFALSAFLLARPYLRNDPPAYWTFLKERFLRLAPAYYVAMALSLLAIYVLYDGPWRVGDVIGNALFLDNLNPGSFFAVNAAFWSLAVEMQFYMLLPLLVRPFRTRWWPLALAACIALSMLVRGLGFIHRDGPAILGDVEAGLWQGTFSLPAFLGHFALGIAAARMREVKHPGMVAALGACIVGYATLTFIAPGSQAYGFETLAGQVLVRPLAGLGFALIVLAAATPGALARVLSLRPLRALGTMSYSLYLIHLVALLLVAHVLDTYAGGTQAWSLLVAGTLASLVFGALLYLGVERPAEAWRHRRRAQAPRTAPA